RGRRRGGTGGRGGVGARQRVGRRLAGQRGTARRGRRGARRRVPASRIRVASQRGSAARRAAPVESTPLAGFIRLATICPFDWPKASPTGENDISGWLYQPGKVNLGAVA